MRHVVYDVTGTGTTICWALVGAVWIVGAVLARRDPAVRRAGLDLAAVAAGAAAVVALRTPASIWRPLTTASPWPRAIGLVVLVVATAGTIWARVALGDLWSSRVVTKRSHGLRTSGPYRLMRHPIYAGILAMLVGTALTQGLGRWIALLTAVALAVAARIRAEERLLTREFPGEYARYRRQVPALIPRPWRGARS